VITVNLKRNPNGNFVIQDENETKVAECLSWKDAKVHVQVRKPDVVRLKFFPGCAATISLATLLKSRSPLL